MSDARKQRGCRYDTDGDGNCQYHPDGCPNPLEQAAEITRLRERVAELEDAAIVSDSLGVYGSEFTRCCFCNAHTEPGKGGSLKHDSECPMRQEVEGE